MAQRMTSRLLLNKYFMGAFFARVPRWIFIVVSSALYSLSFPSLEIPYLSLVALAPFFIWLVSEKLLRRLLLGTILFWFIFAFIVVSFVFDPFLFGAAILLWLGMPVSLFIIRRALSFRGVSDSGISIALLFSMPVVWTVWEYTQAVLAPIPSHIIAAGNTLADTVFFPFASIGGIYGLSFIVIVSNVSLAALFLAESASNRERFIGITGICITTLFFACGSVWSAYDAKSLPGTPFGLRVASFSVEKSFLSYISLYEKSFKAKEASALPRLERYVGKGLDELAETLPDTPLDLVVIPEWLTEYALFSGDHDEQAFSEAGITNNGTLIRAYRNFAQLLKTSVLANANVIDRDGNLFNSSILFDGEGNIIGRYDKTQLVLGSEYWPFRKKPLYTEWAGDSFNASLEGIRSLQFSKNKTPFHTLRLENGIVFGSPICLEGQLPKAFASFKTGGARFLVNDTSQAWVQFNADGYRKMALNTTRILARYYRMPTILGGRNAYAGMIDERGAVSIIFHDQYPHRAFVSEI